MPNPTGGDLYVSVPLTNISIAYLQSAQNFIADKVFPNVPVDRQTGKYFVYDKDAFMRRESKKRAPGAESAGGGFNLDTAPYSADVQAIHKDVSDQDRANTMTPLNLDRDATEYVTQQLALGREADWVSAYFKAGVWGTDITGVAGTPAGSQVKQWSVVGSTPIQDITGQVNLVASKTGFKPNTLVIGPDVFNVLANHVDVIDRIKYTQRGVVTTDILASLFNLDRVLVPYGVINTAPEGKTGTKSFLFGKGALLSYAAPNPGLYQASAGYTFSWTGYLGAGAAGNRIKRFRMEQNESDRIEGEMAYDQHVVAPDLGVYIASAVA